MSLLFQSKVQIYKVRIVGLVSSGRLYRGIHPGYYSGLLFLPTNDYFGARGEASRGLCRWLALAHRVDAQGCPTPSVTNRSRRLLPLACHYYSPIAVCLEVQRRHSLRRRIPVTLRRPSVVAPT